MRLFLETYYNKLQELKNLLLIKLTFEKKNFKNNIIIQQQINTNICV